MSCSRTNTVTPVGFEPRASRFGVRRSTTTPPRSLSAAYLFGAQSNEVNLWAYKLSLLERDTGDINFIYLHAL